MASSLQDLQRQRARLERAKYNTDLWLFLRDVLGYKDLREKPHHEIVDVLLDKSVYYKLVLAPRDSFKSCICTIGYPMWRVAQNPNYRVLIDSQTIERAKMFLFAIKQHIEKESFKEVYGDWKSVPGWMDSKVVIPQRTDASLKEPTFNTGGVNAPVTGGHYDLIVADDIQDVENSRTEVAREKVILHYQTLFPLMSSDPPAELVVVGTRWHHEDVYDWILNHERVETV